MTVNIKHLFFPLKAFSYNVKNIYCVKKKHKNYSYYISVRRTRLQKK